MKTCGFDPCDSPAAGKLCPAHYWQQKNKGELRPIRRRARNGEGSVHEGYRILWKPNHPNSMASGRIAEHRFIMSEKLGRPLLEGENVHHINGDRLDNRPENLELWVTFQPRGQRVEDLLDYANKIIERYGNGQDQGYYESRPSRPNGAGGDDSSPESSGSSAVYS